METMGHEGVKLRSVGIEGEVLIFHLMDINGIGPKLLGVFDGGRIEQFLEGYHQLSNEDCANPDVMARFARKLAKLNSRKVPIRKKPKDYIGIIRENFIEHWPKYQKFIIEKEYPPGTTEQTKKEVRVALDYDWFQLIDWFEQTLPTVRTRVVFSHNDMNIGNCMVHPSKSGDDKLFLLDFEFCGYSYRGCDIGHHFKNRTVNIKKLAKGENALDINIRYPSEEDRRHFVRAYLDVFRDSIETPDDSLDHEDQLLLEAEFYGGLYALFFTSFMITTAEQFKDLPFPVHPGVQISSLIQDYEDRKKNTVNLSERLEKLNLN
jgi:thiamine kinase-like enzyme